MGGRSQIGIVLLGLGVVGSGVAGALFANSDRFSQRAGFPLAPMVLGAILGSMVDENLRRALVLFEHQPMALFGRPLGLALLALILFTLYDGIYRAGRVARPVDNT